ncbi:UTP--glucose-1-phosphate uridylyltransferase [Paenibacillus sp. Soil787]|uniref:UTP--glucose-1-phosphate uridylyltransferase n=1 Tax=Paenibacillus sp. Soil787 TaxID=1736411 RepID=UPI000703B15B|nr:UDPGP type 1 family protein [Paenibacillus sp. Soil787]KRF13621.1 UDP-N-acetylglucosamine pyrophosphorylase [Paenibacillus sp. Soil787]
MDKRYDELYKKAQACGQEHILRLYPSLSEASKSKLLDQIEQLDFAALRELFHHTKQPSVSTDGISPMEAYDSEDYSEEERKQLTETGWDRLRQGKVAALVVAGGQGSRLGNEGPKGTYNIGLPSGKSLFQLQAERLLNLSRRAGRSIPWYIMTSPENHQETVRYFQASLYFGYAPDDIFFFRQNVLPALDSVGRVLLSAKDEIGLTPSGNGDVFASMKRSGALDDLKRRGVEWLFYYNVDNALIRVADPLFVGAAAHHNHPIATKVAEKAYPEEKVGILCLKDGRPAVVEYMDLPKELMYETDSSGHLTYGLGNLSIHLFRTDFIERHADTNIPYHAAHKAVKYIDDQGHPVQPASPNAFKFEKFIFDFFPLDERMTVLKIRREEEFAPIKNKEGKDSPATARRLVQDLYKRWLLEAGAAPSVLEGRDIEISPLVSYAGEGLTPEVLKALLDAQFN